jgi:hypothetical protein
VSPFGRRRADGVCYFFGGQITNVEWDCAGCTLLLCTIESGLHDSNEYADALHLVDRGADPHRVAADAMTLSKMLTAQLGRHPPQAFTQLWAQGHGIVSESE